ncbi:MAG: hypothetical protein ACTTKL_10780, partial [Treponema sp.]
MDFQENAINADFSKRITALRFILACFVVFIHSETTTINFAGGELVPNIPVWVRVISSLITGTTGGGGGGLS